MMHTVHVEVRSEHLYNFVQAIESLTGGSPIIHLAETKEAFNVRFRLSDDQLSQFALLAQAYEIVRL
jgi:hypothetical protein